MKWGHSVVTENDFITTWEACHRAVEVSFACQRDNIRSEVAARVIQTCPALTPFASTSCRARSLRDPRPLKSCLKVVRHLTKPVKHVRFACEAQFLCWFPPLPHIHGSLHIPINFGCPFISHSIRQVSDVARGVQDAAFPDTIGSTGHCHVAPLLFGAVSSSAVDHRTTMVTHHCKHASACAPLPHSAVLSSTDSTDMHDVVTFMQIVPIFIPQCIQEDQFLPADVLRPLAEQWLARAAIEIVESGPCAYVEVWYIHHEHAVECLVPRVVVLHMHAAHWMHDIVAAWQDRVQPLEPLRISIVLPAPPEPPTRATAAHIVLSQGLSPNKVAALFCAVAAEVVNVGNRKFAHSVAAHNHRDNLLRIAYQEPTPRCLADDLLCQVFVADQQWLPGHTGQVADGALVLTRNHMGPPQVLHAVDSTRPAVGTLWQPPDETAPTIPFVVPDYVINLGRAFDMHAMPSEALPPTLEVHVWFIDHRRFPRCSEFRLVRLRPPWTTWAAAMQAVWQDQVDLSLHFEYQVVRPMRMPSSTRIPEVHVILWQRPTVDRRVALFSVMQQGVLRRWALSIPARVTRASVLRFATLTDLSRLYRCLIFHGTRPIQESDSFFAQDGIGITIHVNSIVDAQVDDGISFVQTDTSMLPGAVSRTLLRSRTCEQKAFVEKLTMKVQFL